MKNKIFLIILVVTMFYASGCQTTQNSYHQEYTAAENTDDYDDEPYNLFVEVAQGVMAADEWLRKNLW